MINNLNKSFPVKIVNRFGKTNLLRGIRANRAVELALQDKDVRVNIIQVGAGGTGGYVAAEILRYMGSLPQVLKNKIWYTLIDGDNFEEKNLGRQLCTPDDIGRNKAECLVENLGTMFGCDMNHIKALPEYLTSESQLHNLRPGIPEYTVGDAVSVVSMKMTMSPKPDVYRAARSDRFGRNTQQIDIIIDCVDRTTPRRIIHDMLERNYNMYNEWEEIRSLCNNGMSYRNYWNEYPATFGYISSAEKDRYLHGATNSTKFVELSIGAYGEIIQRWKNRSDNSVVATHRELSILPSGGMVMLPICPETYIISSGNGHYTGQVYWGRYSRTLSGCSPIQYSDIFDEDVNPMLDTTSLEDVTKRANVFNDILEGDQMWPLSAKPKSVAMVRRQVMDALFVKSMPGGGTIPYDLLVSDAVVSGDRDGADDLKPQYTSFVDFVSAHISVPSPYIRHPQLIDPEVDKQEDQMSCADRAEANVQNIQANKTAANLVVNYFNAIMNGIMPLENNEVQPLSTAGVTFDIRNNNMKPEMITTDYLRQYAHKDE